MSCQSHQEAELRLGVRSLKGDQKYVPFLIPLGGEQKQEHLQPPRLGAGGSKVDLSKR